VLITIATVGLPLFTRTEKAFAVAKFIVIEAGMLIGQLQESQKD
jgi:hypothetical protein